MEYNLSLIFVDFTTFAISGFANSIIPDEAPVLSEAMVSSGTMLVNLVLIYHHNKTFSQQNSAKPVLSLGIRTSKYMTIHVYTNYGM